MKGLLKGLGIFAIIVGIIYAITGIDCIKLGRTITVDFKDRSYTATVGDGGGNRGRCGDKKFNIGKMYTMDCFKHDVCQRAYGDDNWLDDHGGLGPNCVGYFLRAIDDFFLAWKCDGE